MTPQTPLLLKVRHFLVFFWRQDQAVKPLLCIRKTDGLMGLSLGSGAPGPQEPEIYGGGVHGAMGHPPELDENIVGRPIGMEQGRVGE